ncbi:transporter substrate-binding domain-containing protein [Aliiglaciecola sp. CAU 1673]|uniref:substrate-binding periplasmic protein n=1 Tax=Aliiglaciecola sp. CAU 1673 TaxID=3032595 RepID=UPI0023DB79FE|nr:transporter substrate-binding domain-containing protein [Aliiglaciecola sp. CAU 1673]MDF2178517.1 transporter substrate-binding domain-containing protein [Aliiglaciecola sp. CAU 1673]
MRSLFCVKFFPRFLLILTLCQSSYGIAAASADKVFKLATGDNYYPYADQSLPQGGWAVALVEALFENMEARMELDVLPWPRAYKWGQELKYDAIFPYVYTDERAKDFYYSDALLQIQVHFYVANDSPIQNLQDTTGKRFCLPMGFELSDEGKTDSAKLGHIIQRAADHQGCLNQVKNGWSDFGMLVGYFTLEHIRHRYGYQNAFRMLPDPADKVSLHLLVGKAQPGAKALVRDLNKAIKALSSSGKREELDAEFMQFIAPPPDS